MDKKRQLLLGGFFLLVLGILGYFTLFQSEFSLFKKQYEMMVSFQDANGLRQGDGVLVAGIRRGRVKSLEFDPQAPGPRRIHIRLVMDEEVPLRDGFEIRIEDATLLGGKHVYIDPGPPEGTIVSQEIPLQGRVATNALTQLGEFVVENRAQVSKLVSEATRIITETSDGRGMIGRALRDDELARAFVEGVNKFAHTADNLSLITDDVRAGKGLAGKLFTDEALAAKVLETTDKLLALSRDLSAVSADLQAGKGLAGRFFKDEELASSVSQAVRDVRDVIARVNSGEGTLGRLITDPSMADDLKALLAGLRSGEGSLGKLLTNDEIYQKLAQAADDIAVVADALRNEKGTLGKLFMNAQLYDELLKAVTTATRSLEEYREAAPITTFTSVLFGAF
jgi:phospholipid/cholesterol/gamma-HCH transport system substrate-binding protein